MQKTASQSTSSVTSFTSAAITVTAGNALAVCSCDNVGWSNPSAGLSMTDSLGDLFAQAINWTSRFTRAQWDLATGCTGGSTTVTVTSGVAAFVSLCAQEYSGVASSPIEEVNHGEGAGLAVDPGVLNPPSAGDVYLSTWTHDGVGNESFTAAASWTLRSNLTTTANMPLGSEEFIGSGSQTGTATLGGAATPNWTAVAMALHAADVTPPSNEDNPNFVQTDFPAADRGFTEPG